MTPTIISGPTATPTSGSGLPAAPSNLTATAVSSAQINLNWTDNATNESDFRVERSPDGAAWVEIATVGANVTAFTDAGLTPNTVYYYRVRAHNASGYSQYSNAVRRKTPRR